MGKYEKKKPKTNNQPLTNERSSCGKGSFRATHRDHERRTGEGKREYLREEVSVVAGAACRRRTAQCGHHCLRGRSVSHGRTEIPHAPEEAGEDADIEKRRSADFEHPRCGL